MQVIPRLKPHNTDTNGIDLRVRVPIWMSVWKKRGGRGGAFYLSFPEKGKGGGGLNRGYTVFFSVYDYMLHQFATPIFWCPCPALSYRLPMSACLFDLSHSTREPLSVLLVVISWTLSFIVVCQHNNKKVENWTESKIISRYSFWSTDACCESPRSSC